MRTQSRQQRLCILHPVMLPFKLSVGDMDLIASHHALSLADISSTMTSRSTRRGLPVWFSKIYSIPWWRRNYGSSITLTQVCVLWSSTSDYLTLLRYLLELKVRSSGTWQEEANISLKQTLVAWLLHLPWHWVIMVTRFWRHPITTLSRMNVGILFSDPRNIKGS